MFQFKEKRGSSLKIPMFDVVTRLHVYSFYFVSVIKHQKIHTGTFYHENKTHVFKIHNIQTETEQHQHGTFDLIVSYKKL